MNEDSLIRWLRRRSGSDRIGDDAAIVSGSGDWAVTMDSQIAGVHFLEDTDPACIAQRLLAVNLSDLAATGATPRYAFLALAAPPGFDHRRFFDALLRACRRHQLELAGGDLGSCPQTTAVLTLLGQKPKGRRRWLGRSSAGVGDRLWLGGTVGEAAAGHRLLELGARLDRRKVRLPPRLEAPVSIARASRRAVRRHLFPEPQLELGHWLGSLTAGGTIDVSDGLAIDLHRLCAASRVGAEIEAGRLPLPKSFRRLARRLGNDWRELALGGGEDYVLLFSLPAGLEPPARFGCTLIGSVLPGKEIHLRESDNERTPLPPLGWDHLAPGGSSS